LQARKLQTKRISIEVTGWSAAARAQFLPIVAVSEAIGAVRVISVGADSQVGEAVPIDVTRRGD
jgi:hypothetical protein